MLDVPVNGWIPLSRSSPSQPAIYLLAVVYLFYKRTRMYRRIHIRSRNCWLYSCCRIIILSGALRSRCMGCKQYVHYTSGFTLSCNLTALPMHTPCRFAVIERLGDDGPASMRLCHGRNCIMTASHGKVFNSR